MTGEWTYTLDNALAAVQELGEGDTLSDSFLVTVTDEDGLTDTRDGEPHDHGQRRRAGDHGRQRQRRRRRGRLVVPAAGDRQSRFDRRRCRRRCRPGRRARPTYGTASIDSATGEWTYTLNNALTAVQELGEGDTLSDSFLVTVTDEDGLTDTVTVNHDHGRRRCAGDHGGQRHGAMSARTRARWWRPAISTRPTSMSATCRPGRRDAATYGTAAIDPATGEWTYTLNNGAAAVQELGEGDTLTDSFLVTVTDEDGLTDTAHGDAHDHGQRRCAGDQQRAVHTLLRVAEYNWRGNVPE